MQKKWVKFGSFAQNYYSFAFLVFELKKEFKKTMLLPGWNHVLVYILALVLLSFPQGLVYATFENTSYLLQKP